MKLATEPLGIHYLSKGNVVLLRNINKECPDPLLDLTLQHIAPVLGRPDQVVEGIVNSMGCASEDHTAIISSTWIM